MELVVGNDGAGSVGGCRCVESRLEAEVLHPILIETDGGLRVKDVCIGCLHRVGH